LLHTSNRLIDSSGDATKLTSIPKAKSVSQSQLTSSKYANHYAVRPEIGHCKYMSQKTMAFWAMAFNISAYSREKLEELMK